MVIIFIETANAGMINEKAILNLKRIMLHESTHKNDQNVIINPVREKVI